MTPTSASSPITLFTTAAPAAKATATNTAEAAPDAAFSGFELLLGAVQQLQEQVSVDGAKVDGEVKDSDNADDEGGNALPQLGTILPSLTTPQPQAAEAAQSEVIDGDGEKKSDDKGDKSTSPDAIAIGWIPGLIVSSARAAAAAPPPDSESPPQNAALGGDGGGKHNGAIAAAAATPNTVNAAAENTLQEATAAAAANAAPAAAKAATESDFDAFVKHFEEPAPAQQLTSVGDGVTVNSASRAYTNNANAANSSATVSIPVGNSGWSDAVADKVMWFSANKISSAEIHLNPPDLGPLQVRVSTQHDQASVVFTSQHAAVRDALDQALPRLRDMMGSQGMHLLDVSVGGQNPQQHQQQQFARNDGGDRSGAFTGLFGEDSADSANVNVTTVNAARLLRSGVDAYA